MKSNGQPTLFERLRAGLQEGIEFARGNVKLKTTELPARPPQISQRTVIALRRRLKLSAPAFARLLNVRVRTVEQWESGQRKPAAAAQRLIQICLEIPQVTEHLLRNGA